MKKKDKPEQSQEIPDALGKDASQDDKLRRSSIPNRHDTPFGDDEIADRDHVPDRSGKESDTPPYRESDD